MVKILLFASFRELLKKTEIEFEISKPEKLVDLMSKITAKYPDFQKVTAQKPLIAVNHEFASGEHEVRDGDEIAMIPPMAGGSDKLVRIQEEDFSVDEEISLVKQSSAEIGGIATFLGTGRDISKGKKIEWLEFEHYPGMAEKKLNQIREQALKDFRVLEVGIVHRTGHIEIGDNIVLITVGARHRKDAFDACRWCIDELKQITPIWKKEKTEDGTIWVEEHP